MRAEYFQISFSQSRWKALGKGQRTTQPAPGSRENAWGGGMGRPWGEEGAETQKPRLVTQAVQTGQRDMGFMGDGEGGRAG